MQTVGSYEAKTHLPELLQRVAAGEEITITRHGVPIAILAPVRGGEKKDIRAAISAILELRKNQTLGKLSVRKLIEEGRR
jgi:prevent-host-death family protein